MNRLRLLLGIASVVASANTTLGAQSSSQNDNNRLRHDCRLAARVIQTGHAAPKMEWAYDIIHVCSEAGAALAGSWSHTLTGKDLANRRLRSAEVNDGRVMLARSRSQRRTRAAVRSVDRHSTLWP